MSLIPKKFTSVVNRELKVGEAVTWSTMPNCFYSMAQAITPFLFGIPWNAFLLFALDRNFSEEQPIHLTIFVLPFYIIGIYLFLTPLIEWHKARNSLYVITNKRAFILRVGRKVSIENFLPENITMLDKSVRSNGSGDLIFSRSHHTDSDGDKQTTSYGFFALPDVAAAEKHIDRLISR